jgi:hypothetical protein
LERKLSKIETAYFENNDFLENPPLSIDFAPILKTGYASRLPRFIVYQNRASNQQY